jgi:hypothetical protein
MPKSETKQPPRKKPVSEKQLAANRANAAKSTGPTSEDGKARSSRNSTQHGFSSTSFTVVRLEDIDEVARLRADLIAAYKPVNSQELFALEQLAIRQQAMFRSARFESGLFSACLNESVGPDGAPFFPLQSELTYGLEIAQAQNRNFCLADGFLRLARHGNGIQIFLQYQAQTERLYRRAVEDFERIRKLRPELPNEPISQNEEPSEPTENTKGSAGGLAAGPTPIEPISSPPLCPSGAGASACQPAETTGVDEPAPSACPSDPPTPNEPISSLPLRPGPRLAGQALRCRVSYPGPAISCMPAASLFDYRLSRSFSSWPRMLSEPRPLGSG